jgi:phage-related protein (TIGR01555 family)
MGRRNRPTAKTTSAAVNDTLTNLVSGMGVLNQDKSVSNQYSLTIIPPNQLENAYRSDWVAGKAVDIPAEDATSEWRAWNATAEQISLLEKCEQNLGVQAKTESGIKKGRLYGGGAIVIGIKNQEDVSLPINLDAVGQGDLQYLHDVSRWELTAGEIDWDLGSEYFGRPKYYRLSTGNTVAVDIHPSRVVHFNGRDLPSRKTAGYDGWGDSIIQRIDDAVKHSAIPQQQIATLLMEANVDVIKIPGFMAQVSTDEYRSKLISRWQLAAVMKSINRGLILDKDEEWTKLSPNFSGLKDLAMMYMEIASGAADVPATRMLGKSPDGLSATGQSDLENYYKMIGNVQKNKISPALRTLDECIIRSALGSRPPEVYCTWRPLWTLSETQKTDNFLKKTQGIVNLVNTGLFSGEQLMTPVMNMLTEDGTLPGIEQQEVPIDLDENDPEVKEQFNNAQE